MDDGLWAASLLGSVLLGPGGSLAQFPLLQQLFGKGAGGLQEADHRGQGKRGQTAPAAGWDRHPWEDSTSSHETTCSLILSIFSRPQVSWSRESCRQSCVSSRQQRAACWTSLGGPSGSGPTKHCGGFTASWLTCHCEQRTSAKPSRCSWKATPWRQSVHFKKSLSVDKIYTYKVAVYKLCTQSMFTEYNRLCSSQSCWIKFVLPLSAEDKQVEGEAAYQLGLTYQRAGDTETAKKVPYCRGRVEPFPPNAKMDFKFDQLTTLCPVLQHLHADLHVTPGRGRPGKVLLCHDQVFREVCGPLVFTHSKISSFYVLALFYLSLTPTLRLYLCVCVSEGNVEETVQYLEMLADISHSHGLEHNLPDAYLCLGNIYYAKVWHHLRYMVILCIMQKW